MGKATSNVIMGPWAGTSRIEAASPLAEDQFLGNDYRAYDQCCVQQEQAFRYGKYYEIFIVNLNKKRCFVKPCSRAEAIRQMQMRGLEVE